MFFLRKSTQEALPVAMSGVRMGERALQIGIDDPAVAGAGFRASRVLAEREGYRFSEGMKG